LFFQLLILAYFNFNKCKRRTQLFLEFVERFRNLTEICLVIAAATVSGIDLDLESFVNIQGIYAHHKFTLKHMFWCIAQVNGSQKVSLGVQALHGPAIELIIKN